MDLVTNSVCVMSDTAPSQAVLARQSMDVQLHLATAGAVACLLSQMATHSRTHAHVKSVLVGHRVKMNTTCVGLRLALVEQRARPTN